MARVGVKVKDEERLEDANIQLVIEKLNGEKPITKKEACQILNISYNTTRLEKIITGFLEKQELRSKRRAANRGKPASESETSGIISDYLKGENVSNLSEQYYRSSGFVKRILDDNHVPTRSTSADYRHPELIPDGAVRDKFSIGEKVFSARYESLATIKREFPPKSAGNPHDCWVYGIYLEDEKWLENAYQPAYELASLEHLRTIGIKL